MLCSNLYILVDIHLRKIENGDLERYKYWQLPMHKYHDFNGPYFKKLNEEEVDKEMNRISEEIRKGNNDPIPNKKIISNENRDLIGEVNWYWKSKETNWLEVGIVIFNEKNWGKGIGKQALKLWIKEIFDSKKEIIRIGLTTWSGNHGMMNLAEKLKMKREAVYRKARIVNGKYFDSVSYGLLREEWALFEKEN